ncbi:MAG: AarF/ABC1/UbiB kinase family protein [Deltaproteobacteria bacterium]|nr:AarF/ABC1/UbiB kinase family protein [Deltaproteobacteria bacterium]
MSKLGRIAKLGTLTTRVSGSYLGQQVAGLFQGEESRKSSMRKLHLENAERIVDNLGALKGAAMKVGQAVAQVADSLDLPADARAVLGRLHDKAVPVPFEQVKSRIEAELGGATESLFARLDPEPLGTASLGQVHAAQLKDGQEVVVKVLHAGVEEAIHSDLAALKAMLVGGRFLRRPKEEIDAWFDEIDARLAEEIDYRKEAENTIAFRRLLAGEEGVIVPRVHEGWCTGRVLTLERLSGRPLSQFIATSTAAARQAAGVRLARTFFHLFYWHRACHADPHPGNYLFMPDGRIGLIDFGCVRYFDLEWVAHYGGCAWYTKVGDKERVMEHALGMGALARRDANAEDALWTLCRAIGVPFRGGDYTVGGPEDDAHEQITRAMPRVMVNPTLRAPQELVFLHRALGGIYSINKQLKPSYDWGELLRESYQTTLFDSGRSSSGL